MKQANEETIIDTNTDDFEPKQLGDDIKYGECYAFHRKLHEVSIFHLRKLKKLPKDELSKRLEFV